MKVIVIPQDAREPIREVELDGSVLSFQQVREISNIQYMENINTKALQELELVILVDDDGFQRGLSINQRGMLLAQYPGGLLVGDIVVARMGLNPLEGGYDHLGVREGDLKNVKEAITRAAAGMI